MMERDDGREGLPQIVVRIPGSWSSPANLADSLPPAYRLGRGKLHLPNGERVEVIPLPPDDEFPAVFASACRGAPSAADQRTIDNYSVSVCLTGTGGSVEAAGRMLQAAAAVTRAGGAGVFVDNGAIAHWSGDWIGLASDPDDQDLFSAFVATVSSPRELASVGMHVFGLRDAVIRRSGDEHADLFSILGFLGYTLAPDKTIVEGDLVGDEGAPCFRLCSEGDERFPPDSPLSNPYGRWRLLPLVVRG